MKKERGKRMKRKIRYLHMGDSHNGYTGKTNASGEYEALPIDVMTEEHINVREDDCNKSFAQCVDIAIEEKVDFVLHAGDLFDKWGYKNPNVYDAVHKEVKRLTEAGIPFVVIIGNHDLPDVRGKGVYLKTLSRIPGVHAVYQGFYEQIELEEFNTVLHCVPSTFHQSIMDESLEQVEFVPGKFNIGMAHVGVTTIKHYAESSEKTLVLELDTLVQKKLHYWALGDYHKRMTFGHNIWYSGSTERLGFGEVANAPGVLIVEMEELENGEVTVEVEEHLLNVRPMYDLPVIDAKDKPIETINEEIVKRIQNCDLDGSIVRLRITQLPVELKPFIDQEKIEDMTKSTLYFKIDYKDKILRTDGVTFDTEVEIENIRDGWSKYVEQIPSDVTFDRRRIEQIGDRLIEEAMNKID